MSLGCRCRPLEGKLAIVTGGSRGVGLAIVEKLASQGCDIVLAFTSESSILQANRSAAQFSKFYNVRIFPVREDLGSIMGPAGLVAQARSLFSSPDDEFQIDIIINNAGISSIAPIPKIEAQEIQEMYAVNVQGPLLLVKAAQPYLPTDRSGRIVNISSISATLGFVGQSVYGGTKAALDAMTRTWSRELAENATVNSVNPGPVATELYENAGFEFYRMIKPFMQIAPLSATREDFDGRDTVLDAQITGGRAATVSEIAAIVSMICSEDSAWCTGSMISANGGMIFSL